MTGTVQTHEAQIRQLLNERAAATPARNAEALVSCFAPEAIEFDLAPPLQP